MRFVVSFADVFDNVESEEDAYEALLNYLSEVVRNRDVTAFDFVPLKDGIELENENGV